MKTAPMRTRGLSVEHPKIFGVTESSITVVFGVCEGDRLVDAEASVRVGPRTVTSRAGEAASRVVRVEGLEADTEYDVEIQVAGAPPPDPNRHFEGRARTQAAPRAGEVATLATLNDLHFGEGRMGGTLTEDHEYGEAAPGFGVVSDRDYDRPYAEFMNEDAVSEINRAGVDAAIVKGDIADRGLPEQFETAARVFAGFEMPHHAFLGNHDYLAQRDGQDVDGYALLGQPKAPRAVDLAGWRLLLLETSAPGHHHGEFDGERREWLEDALAESGRAKLPTLLFMHHQPVPPEHADSYPNTIGLRPEHSLRFFDVLAAAPQVKGVLIGHTHRNRVRRYPRAGPMPFAEVNNSKDYPGGFAHYRLFEDGSFRQEVRRTSTPRALGHARRCRGLFKGLYKDFALGRLHERSFVVTPRKAP